MLIKELKHFILKLVQSRAGERSQLLGWAGLSWAPCARLPRSTTLLFNLYDIGGWEEIYLPHGGSGHPC